jgi:hypothetical protein
MRIIPVTAAAVASVVVGVTATIAVPALASAATASATARPSTARPAALPAGDLGGVACQTAQNCLAVGVNDPDTPDSVARAASWNGKAWQAVTVKLTAGATAGQLDGVSCLSASATDCVAVGGSAPQGNPSYYTSEFVDSWNGRAWAPLALNNDAILTLKSVSCLSRKDCLAVGIENSPVGGYSNGIAVHWNGATWTALAPPEPSTTTGFTSVSCAAGPFCVVIGNNYVPTTRTLIDVWNGRTWKTLAPAKAKGVTDLVLNSVSCTSARSCVAVGNGTGTGTRGEVAEVWNGRSWTATAPIAWPRGATSPWVDSVSCATARYCLAAGYIDRNPKANGANTGRAAASVWNGKSWTATSVAAPGKGKASLFNGVTCPRTTFCAAVGQVGPYDGSSGTELAALWDGRNWRVVG